MPSDDWAQGLGWSRFQEKEFTALGRENDAVYEDKLLRNAYELGWFNQDVDSDYRKAARDFAKEWLLVEYGVDFDAEFDWAEWRERYAAGDV